MKKVFLPLTALLLAFYSCNNAPQQNSDNASDTSKISQEIEAYLSHATDERIRSIYSKEEIFRLIITDKDGVPVAGCGKFVFKTMIGQAALVKSEVFCHENQFKALETCRYLRDHKEDLSFIVEKLN